MVFLLKVTAESFSDEMAVVPRMKSAALGPADIGSTVYVWLGDAHDQKGALHGVATLTAIESITVPQVRVPTRQKDAYRLTLGKMAATPVHPLGTDDLGPYRYVEGADGIDSLNRIHRDRNDKIIRLTGAEADVLAERFRQ